MLNKERDTQPDTVKITCTRIDENIGTYVRYQVVGGESRYTSASAG